MLVAFLGMARASGFRCDYSMLGFGGKTLPEAFVNDDYCDCVDGSDEWKTNGETFKLLDDTPHSSTHLPHFSVRRPYIGKDPDVRVC